MLVIGDKIACYRGAHNNICYGMARARVVFWMVWDCIFSLIRWSKDSSVESFALGLRSVWNAEGGRRGLGWGGGGRDRPNYLAGRERRELGALLLNTGPIREK